MIVTTSRWAGAAILWTHPSGADTFRTTGNRLNAYAVAVELRDWLEDAARPWAGATSAFVLTVGNDGKRHWFGYTHTGTAFTSRTPNSVWISRMGDTSQSPPTVCYASCAALPGTVRWDRYDSGQGEATRDSSWRSGHAQTSHRSPSVDIGYTLEQTFARDQMLRLAVEPREAYIYDEVSHTWRFVALGPDETTAPMGDVTISATTFQVLG